MNKLHVDSIRKSYYNKTILSDVFISCDQGEIVALMGRNGAGKSTLMKIIFGSEKSDSKFVRIGEKVMRGIGDGRNLINYLPQDHFLPDHITIRCLINLFLQKENKKTLLKNPFVIPILNKKSGDLSGGERRIIEVLLIIHSDAQFILLDEPFNGLSPALKEYIVEYIEKNKLSKGFIITDHDHNNVIKLADKLTYLQNGFLREIEDKRELVELGYITKTMYQNMYAE